MVTSVCNGGTVPPAASSVAALSGQIRRDRIQLDDWTTCVSAKTPKGQAEIQRLSGQISAEREQLTRAETAPDSPSGALSNQAGAAAASSPEPLYGPQSSAAGPRHGSLHVLA